MPTLEFLASRLGPAITVEAEGALVDICDDAHAPVGFSCRSANCGTCCVEIVAGAELLEPPREDELDVLRALDAPSDRFRLACQAHVRCAPGVVRLRWVSDVGE